jgi:hypothetical protein
LPRVPPGPPPGLRGALAPLARPTDGWAGPAIQGMSLDCTETGSLQCLTSSDHSSPARTAGIQPSDSSESITAAPDRPWTLGGVGREESASQDLAGPKGPTFRVRAFPDSSARPAGWAIGSQGLT